MTATEARETTILRTVSALLKLQAVSDDEQVALGVARGALSEVAGDQAAKEGEPGGAALGGEEVEAE